MNNYVQLQIQLKSLAEDCAVGAALLLDSRQYSKGLLVIDRESAEDCVAFLVDKAPGKAFRAKNGSLDWSMEIFDDEKGYTGCGEYNLSEGKPSVAVTISYEDERLFRLPFIGINRICRTAVYRWE